LIEDHRNRIYGLHIEEWTYGIEEKDPEEYERRFRKWSECLDANDHEESYENLYKKVHQAIRANPSYKKKESTATKHSFESEKLIQG
jgi:large subunit ribosomal protein L5e